jgi:hypothetical protein
MNDLCTIREQQLHQREQCTCDICSKYVQVADSLVVVDDGNLVCMLSVDTIWVTSSTVQWKFIFVPVNEVLRECDEDIRVTTGACTYSKVEHHPDLFTKQTGQSESHKLDKVWH